MNHVRDEDWIELQRERVVHHQTGKFGHRRHRSRQEREYTPDQMCIRQMSKLHSRLRKSGEDTSVLVGQSHSLSPERDLKNRMFLYNQLLSRGKSRNVRNRVLKGSQIDCYLLPSSLFGSGLSKHQRSNETLDTEDSAVRKVWLEPKKPKMFVGESPQSWVNKPESTAGEPREEFRRPHLGEELDMSAVKEAKEVNSEEVRDESILEETEEVVSEEAEVATVGDLLVAVASADVPNKPADVEAGEDLDGHGPLVLSHVPPVNPTPQSRSWRSWGDEVEALLGDEVAPNDGVPFR